MSCIFCEIIKGNIPVVKVYEDEFILAFDDIDPQAPSHVVLIPKNHYTNILEIPEDGMDYRELLKAMKEIAKIKGIEDSGFRIVTNCKKDGGQTVEHLHYHILGGRSLQWPPG
ncbi:MAG: HIT domain-containing protein [Filifactoraceae bacterium]